MILRLVAVMPIFMHPMFLSNVFHTFQVLLLSHPKKDIRETSEYEIFRRLDGLSIYCELFIFLWLPKL